MKAAGIDIGTTSISAVVLETERGQVLEAVTVENGSFIATENVWERIQDPAVILEKAKRVLDELLDRFPDIASIGLTGQMHGILYTGREGKSLSPLFTWQDQRGSLPGRNGRTLVEEMKERTGMRVFAGYGLVTHLYQCRQEAVPEGADCLCTIPDYLGMVLTGRKRPLLHVSMAASLGLFDAEAGAFCKEALSALGMDMEILPEVTSSFEALGMYRGRPVSVAIGDNQASFLGAVGLQEHTVLLNMGTGGQISVLSKQFFETEGVEARPLTEGYYILVGASLCGGRAYAILEQFFRSYARAIGAKDVPQYEVMERLADLEQEKDAMCVTTTFNGTRANPELRGSITNLSERNFTPEGMVRGVMTGMARELYELFEKIHQGTGIEAHRLVASGNGVRKNKVLRQILEELFGAGLSLAKYEEEAACGAARCGQQSAGKIRPI